MRGTIALLADTLVDGYQQTVWAGVNRATEERDLNLLCFLSGYLTTERPGRRIFELLDGGRISGIVALSGSLASQTSDADLRAIYARLAPVPLIGIGRALPGVPTLLVNNEASIAAMVDHLVLAHGRRELAFVRGPPTNTEAELRYGAFRAALARHGLPEEPARVLPGAFDAPSGLAAARELLARGVRFDALLAANDYMAIGALEELRRRGIRVPEQVSVAGFDDVREAPAVPPGLATVRQPFFQMGRDAVQLVLDVHRGAPVPPITTYAGELALRRSCGCGVHARRGRHLAGGAGTGSAPPARAPAIGPAELAAGLAAGFPDLSALTGVSSWASQVAAALLGALEGGDDGPLWRLLESLLAAGDAAHVEVGRWFAVLDAAIEALRAARPELDGPLRDLHEAGLRALGLAAEQLHVARGVELEQDVNLLRRVWELNPVDPAEVWVAMQDRLPVLGVPSLFLCRFADAETTQAHLEHSYALNQHVTLDGASGPFDARRLVPGTFSSTVRHAFMVWPIKVRSQEIGYAVCEMGRMGGPGYESLIHQLGAATELRLLLAEIRDQAAGLEAKVEERTRELAEAQRLVVDTAHRAGMAEIAVGLMHNMGNLLNSVNVSAERISDLSSGARLAGLVRAGALLDGDPAAVAAFLTGDPRGALLPRYLREALAELERERAAVQAETRELLEKTGTIRETIKTLQEYARGGQDLSMREPLDLRAVVETALRLQESNLSRHGVKVVRELAPAPPVVAQRSKLVHVVVNLVKNGIEAMRATPAEARVLLVQLRDDAGEAELRVRDAGEGIAPAHLPRVFSYGFTTKPGGHGFGLHTCANHVAQMGGTIRAESPGVGRGATFSLRFPPPGEAAP